MIQRFCFVKLLDDEVDGRSAFADLLRAQLAEAGADAVVGLPADDSAIKWDLSIVITTASLAAWTALSRLPALLSVFDQIATRAKVIKAWSFEAPSQPPE